MIVFGGVEGGATHSTLVLFNEKSEALTTVEGPGTNLFQIGMDETCNRIVEMKCQAMKNLGKEIRDYRWALTCSIYCYLVQK